MLDAKGLFHVLVAHYEEQCHVRNGEPGFALWQAGAEAMLVNAAELSYDMDTPTATAWVDSCREVIRANNAY